MTRGERLGEGVLISLLRPGHWSMEVRSVFLLCASLDLAASPGFGFNGTANKNSALEAIATITAPRIE